MRKSAGRFSLSCRLSLTSLAVIAMSACTQQASDPESSDKQQTTDTQQTTEMMVREDTTQSPVAEASSTCKIPAQWISDGVPDPIILAKNSAFGSFCDFHTWSWNAFLWSMEETDGILRFESFPTQEQTIDESFAAENQPEKLRLQARAAKADHPIDSVAQAGTLGILVAQNKRGIYYSQHVNPQMYKQIVDDNWNTAQGLTDESPDALFDIGNIEYKAAWAVVDENFSVPGAYTRMASIPELATKMVDGVPTITVPKNPTYVDAQVALIGFHVVGWVNQHSEAIWASFSPDNIAPVVPTDANGNATIEPGAPVSNNGTPFYTAGTPLSECNQEQVPVQKLNDATQEFELTSQACQFYATGTIGGTTTDNGKTIEAMNESAAATLPAEWAAAQYREIGAVWSNSDSSTPDKLNSTFQDALVGSNVLSNPVIETFTQTDVAQHNCFSCHNSLQFQPSDPDIPPLHASMLNLSHFLLQIYVDTYQPQNQTTAE